jgi:hypothetical protein
VGKKGKRERREEQERSKEVRGRENKKGNMERNLGSGKQERRKEEMKWNVKW